MTMDVCRLVDGTGTVEISTVGNPGGDIYRYGSQKNFWKSCYQRLSLLSAMAGSIRDDRDGKTAQWSSSTRVPVSR